MTNTTVSVVRTTITILVLLLISSVSILFVVVGVIRKQSTRSTYFHTTTATTNSNTIPTTAAAASVAVIRTKRRLQWNNPGTNCTPPQFLSPWLTFQPGYPLNVTEPMGLILGNDMVAFSGFLPNFIETTNKTYARDLTNVNSTWRQMDDMPMAIALTHAPLVRVGNRVYMCGGYLGAHPGPHSPYCFMYDHSIPPGTGQQWTRLQDLPNNGYAGGGMIYDTVRNTLYFAGGGQRTQHGSVHPIDSNRAYKYSLSNPTMGWVEIAPIPYAANHISSVTQNYMGQERHYFFGGQLGEYEVNQNLPNMYEFIPSTETWITRTNLPEGRGHTTASTRPIKCGFITAGGSVNSASNNKNRTNTVLYYDIPTDRWSTIGTITSARATPLVDVHSNGYMYFAHTKMVRRKITL